MPRAGQGTTSFDRYSGVGDAGFRYRLTFETSTFFDAIYKMRDTLDCFYGRHYELLHSSKRTDEGRYYAIDELTFSYAGDRTSVHSRRYTLERVKIDTLLSVGSGCVSDMLGAACWLRTLNYEAMRVGNRYPLTVAIGRDLVKVSFRYQGKSVIEFGDMKYRTHYFLIDILDEAFEQKSAAAELWVGDDANYIPVRIRAKLKIGYAEIYYKSSANLKAPLSCRLETER